MEFKNEFNFLSNLYKSPVHYEGKEFPSVETAYQYAKCVDEEDKKKFLFLDGGWIGGYMAINIGRMVKLRDDWSTARIGIMCSLLEDKFLNNPLLRETLRNTGRIEIVQDDWEDEFWSLKKGKGQNILGKMIMKIRDYIQEEDGFPLKVIVAGSRKFHNYDLLKEKLDYYLKETKDPVIVSGHTTYVDVLGEKYSIERHLAAEIYPAEFEKYGRQARYICNETLAEKGDVLVAFWNKSSKGTEHLIKTMRRLKKPVRIVYV